MTYTQIGDQKKSVSRLGFGCMRFPEKDGKIDREKSFEMIDRAYKLGINYFDTAHGYHKEESEQFTGEALARYPRESYSLATKLPIYLVKEKEDVERLFNQQMERCGTGYFDYYLIHSLDTPRWELCKQLGVYEMLLEKKRQGLIRALGFSYHGSFDTFCEIVDSCAWDLVQIQMNYIDYSEEMQNAKVYYDKLCEKNLPCIIMEPVRGGFLAGLPEAAAAELAKVNGDSAAKWALRWCMNFVNTPVILSGMSTMEQVEENVEIFSEAAPMTEEELAAVERARRAAMDTKVIPCTDCRYCMPCPFGVDIPGVFGVYNRYKLFNVPFYPKLEYPALGEGADASFCTRCGACVPLCPQGIEIPDRLAEVHEVITSLE